MTFWQFLGVCLLILLAFAGIVALANVAAIKALNWIAKQMKGL